MYQRILPLLFMAIVLHIYPAENHTYHINAGPLFNFARYNLGELPKIQGYLAGIHTDFQIKTKGCFYTELTFNGRWDAGFICGDQDTKSQIKDYRPEWFFGYNWCVTDKLEVTPFTGLGFYYLSNELKPDIMTFRYFALFPPVGLTLNWNVRPGCFDLGFSTRYRPYVWRQLKLETPCIIEQSKSKKIDLKYSQGLHIKLPLTWHHYPCNRCFDLQLKVVPFFDWNRFARADEANSNGICFEVPQLDQWYLGLHVDLGVSF